MAGFKYKSTQTGGLQQAGIDHPGIKIIYTYTWKVGDISKVRGSKTIYLKEVTLPAISFDVESIKTGHADYQFAKQVKWEDVKLTFYDTEGITPSLLEAAQNVWHPDKGIRVASEYMEDTTITAYYADGNPAYKWTLKNSWIKAVTATRLTYESSGVNNVNVTVAYSWAECGYGYGTADKPGTDPTAGDAPSTIFKAKASADSGGSASGRTS